MPLITIQTSSQKQNDLISPILDKLRYFVAKKLSCSSRELNMDEISVRVITADLSMPIADIEIVIIAYSYPERVDNQDEISLSVKKFIEDRCIPFTAYVWLQLSELGHSA